MSLASTNPEDMEVLPCPNLSWRIASTATMLFAGSISKGFLKIVSRTETEGMDEFLKLLDERKDVEGRTRGLITASNHVSVLDDPLIWGVLPWRYILSPKDMRWSLGSYDICFKNNSNSAMTTFFNYGQVLPTHRLHHSPHGGPFQPTITQCIRLLSSGPFGAAPHYALTPLSKQIHHDHPHVINPPAPVPLPPRTYTTTGADVFPSPSAYLSRKHSWIHIFPEGKVHQKADKSMRYFKWGVARLILESEPCPDFVPMWIEGPQEVMHESRTFPRWFPRWGKNIKVCFGEKIGEEVWRPFRERWRRLRDEKLAVLPERKRGREGWVSEEVAHAVEPVVEEASELGVLPDRLKYGEEVLKLRMDVAYAVREAVLKLRRKRGLPEEDPKARQFDTWIEEGGRSEGKMDDGSWTKNT